MKAYIYDPAASLGASVRAAESIRAGFDAVRIDHSQGRYRQPIPDDADFIVVFGWDKKWLDGFLNFQWPRNARIREAQSRGLSVLCVERGCIAPLGRDDWHMLTWDGLNGRGQWLSGEPGDRWDRVFASRVRVQDWKDGDTVALMGQVPRDASIDTCPDYQAWLDRMAYIVSGASRGKTAVFRPHPKARGMKAGGLPVDWGSLQDLLDRCSVTFAWNSTVGVESVICGVRHVAADCGSMAVWPRGTSCSVTPHTRTDWLRSLAYAQWRDDEIRDGTAWRHLVGVLEEIKEKDDV